MSTDEPWNCSSAEQKAKGSLLSMDALLGNSSVGSW